MPSTIEDNRTYRQNVRLYPKDKESYVAESCWQTEKHRSECESDVLNALNRQQNDLLFWRSELEHCIERVSAENRSVQQCITNLEFHQNFLTGLLHSVKRCQDLRYFQVGAGNVVAGDATHNALAEENLLLSKHIESIEDQIKEANNLHRQLKTDELTLIEDLKFKTASLEATKKSDSLHIVYKENNQDPELKHHFGNPNHWQEELERHLESSVVLLSRSRSFRDAVRNSLSGYIIEVTAALCKSSALLQQDEATAHTTRERTMTLLTQVNEELVLTRERNVMLRTEIGKQRRHIQAINTRMHLFRVKPSSEQISDEPLVEMQNQIEKAKENLSALEKSYEDWCKKEKDLTLTQMNLRQNLEKANRTFFLYKDEVKGQRRVGSDSSIFRNKI